MSVRLRDNSQSVMDDQEVSTVFFTGYTYSSEPTFCIIVYNAQLPVGVVRDERLRLAHLDRLNQLLVNDFGAGTDIFYQVTGCFTLVNRVTGARQTWTGSFFTNLIFNPSLIQSFRRFDSETFTRSSFELLGRAEDILRTNGNNSDWTFESLKTVVFNIQTKKRKNDALVARRNLRFDSRVQRMFHLF